MCSHLYVECAGAVMSLDTRQVNLLHSRIISTQCCEQPQVGLSFSIVLKLRIYHGLEQALLEPLAACWCQAVMHCSCSKTGMLATAALQRRHLEQLQHLLGDSISIALVELHRKIQSSSKLMHTWFKFDNPTLRPLQDLQTELAGKLQDKMATCKDTEAGNLDNLVQSKSAAIDLPRAVLEVEVCSFQCNPYICSLSLAC